MQLRSRAEHTRETLHPSYHSGGTKRGSELPQMHSNVLAKEGLVSRTEGIQKKKNRLENSRRERSRDERKEGRKEYRKGLLLLSQKVMSDSFAMLWTVTHQAPLSMGFARQEYWSGLPFPSPGDLPSPGFESVSPALVGEFFTTESPGKPQLTACTGWWGSHGPRDPGRRLPFAAGGSGEG